MTEVVVRYRSSGGVVLDREDRVLLIERTVDDMHEIRLPKGHIEPGETAEAAALREVCEETGYCDLEFLFDLGWQTTRFRRNEQIVVRSERYFMMRLTSDRQLSPSFSSDREALFQNFWADSLVTAEGLLTFTAEQAVVQRARMLAGVEGIGNHQNDE